MQREILHAWHVPDPGVIEFLACTFAYTSVSDSTPLFRGAPAVTGMSEAWKLIVSRWISQGRVLFPGLSVSAPSRLDSFLAEGHVSTLLPFGSRRKPAVAQGRRRPQAGKMNVGYAVMEMRAWNL